MREASSSNCDGEQAGAVVSMRAEDDIRSSQCNTEYSFSGMQPRWVFVLLISIPIVAALFWWLGTRVFHSALNLLEYLEFATLVTAVVTGG